MSKYCIAIFQNHCTLVAENTALLFSIFTAYLFSGNNNGLRGLSSLTKSILYLDKKTL